MTTRYANLIKESRIKRGLSQSQVAVSLGMSRPSYISIEQGKKDLTLSEFD
ncbi:MAG: helix-turn-helix transcriptional regulator, partial [bacterium]